MPKLALPAAAALSLAVAIALAGCNGGGGGDLQKFTVGVIGDVPYGTTPTDTSQTVALPGLVNAINADVDASLVLHVGDIHSGKQYCTEAYDSLIASDWRAFRKPLIYTPGDNEWTDCNKAGEGGGTWNTATGTVDYVVDAFGNKVSYAGGDPLANLDLVRRTFFANPGKDFTGSMDVHTQAREYDPVFPNDAGYVENVWFEKSGVLFVTINVPGGSNNDTDPWYAAPSMSTPQSQEVANRSAADLRWLDTAFKRAALSNDFAVVIQLQADMWDLDGKAATHLTQYKQFIDSIATKAKDFGKPVLLFNGDSHIYRSDNPLVAGAACVAEPSSGAPATACADDDYANQPHGYNVPNFHRVVVHGSTTPLEWLKLTVDPNYDRGAATTPTSFGPFKWQRVPVS